MTAHSGRHNEQDQESRTRFTNANEFGMPSPAGPRDSGPNRGASSVHCYFTGRPNFKRHGVIADSSCTFRLIFDTPSARSEKVMGTSAME